MGDVFAGRYELVDPLGEGGAGVVWRVWDLRQRRYCAAKVLRQVDASSLLRFMREQSLRLDHPHILAPTGWAGEDDRVLFTMPIADGGSVATLVSDFGPLPARLCAVLLDQLLWALEAIHSEGIVHRDVKPANLLLDATGTEHPQLWLGDFGIASGQDAPRLTQGPFTVGTPGYLAPESRTQGWQPEPRADLYAAGMCAVEMLTGLSPAADADIRRPLEAAQREAPVPPALAAVVEGLGHPVLTQRFPSAAEARTALQRTGLLEPASSSEILGEVELFEHTPPLPPGWNGDGPIHAAGSQTEAASAPAHAASSPATPSPSPSPSPSAPEATAAVMQEPPTATNVMEAEPDRPTWQQVPQLSAAEPHSGPQLQQPRPATDRRPTSAVGRGAAIALILMGAGLVLLALTVYLAFG